MGAGMQQPVVSQGQAQGAGFADVFKVLYEPAAVFERVRTGSNFFAPFLTIIVAQCIIFFVNVPYLKVGLQAQLASQGRPVPSTGVLAGFGLVFLVIILAIILAVSGLILWVMSSIMGSAESKFSTLLSVAAYSAIPSAIVLAVVGSIVIHLQGVGQITSPQDLQPALGLDLLAPGAKGFVGAVLKAINPFSLWGLVLMAIGVSTTQRTSKANGYICAVVAFVVLLVIGGGLASLQG